MSELSPAGCLPTWQTCRSADSDFKSLRRQTRRSASTKKDLIQLLTNTKPGENPIEDIVRDRGTDDFAEVVDGLAQIDGDKLVAAADHDGFRGRFERLARANEALTAAGRRAGARTRLTRLLAERGRNRRPELRQTFARVGARRKHPA